jgi:uncharacterized protein
MNSFVRTVGRVESLDLTRVLQLHVFDYHNRYFAFDPGSISLIELEQREADFLKACKEPGGRDFSISDLDQNDILPGGLLEGLIKKGLFSPPRTKRDDDQMPGHRVEVLVNATQECNLACQYCFVDRGKFGYGDDRVCRLSPQLAERLVSILPKAIPWAKEFCIHFYGGEPLLNLPAIQAAVEAAAKSDCRFMFAITTNGTVCDENILSVLRKGRFTIILSIDGPSAVHDAFRKTQLGQPTHAKVINFLNLVRADPALKVRGSSVVRRNWPLNEAYSYLKTLPIDLIKAQAIRIPEGHPLALTREERSEYVQHLSDIAWEVIQGLKRGEAPKDDRFSSRVLQVLIGMRRTSFCGAGRSIFGVSCDGTVYPCVLLAGHEGMALGNMDDRETDWVEHGRIWANKPANDRCINCWALPLCGGGCPAMVSVCGEDECEISRASCELALAIYGFIGNKIDLLTLAGISGELYEQKT